MAKPSSALYVSYGVEKAVVSCTTSDVQNGLHSTVRGQGDEYPLSRRVGRQESQVQPQEGPSFDEVVRKMLNTPPKPKKGSPRKKDSPALRNGGMARDGADG